jgi:hypothetical protein
MAGYELVAGLVDQALDLLRKMRERLANLK